jgi:hypothetical protein
MDPSFPITEALRKLEASQSIYCKRVPLNQLACEAVAIDVPDFVPSRGGGWFQCASCGERADVVQNGDTYLVHVADCLYWFTAEGGAFITRHVPDWQAVIPDNIPPPSRKLKKKVSKS